MYIADELGFVKIWNLEQLLREIDIGEVESYTKTKASFNPKRNETLDASKSVLSYRKE